MNEFRCTRPDVYDGECPGARDLSARQGYYVNATDEVYAFRYMRMKFPQDTKFDIQKGRSL